MRRWPAQVNTRLQVEHGITEYVSRKDLVQWMLQLQVHLLLPPPPPSTAVRHDCTCAMLKCSWLDSSLSPSLCSRCRLLADSLPAMALLGADAQSTDSIINSD